ncbi:MAG: DsbA family protein [Ardenticatenaceae bacterium]
MAKKKKKKDVPAAPKPKRRRANQRRSRKRSNNLSGWLLLGGVVVLLLLGYFYFSSSSAPPVDAARLADDPLLGTEAPVVTIVEFGDFGCHACQGWHQAGIREQIMANYGDQVRFVWRDFPVITPQSPKAAEAAQCAHDQGRFWDYHDLLYERAPKIGESDLKEYAAEVGLDSQAFESCLDSNQHQATVQHDLDAARDLRLRGTPSFVVDGQVLTGPPSYQTLEGLIQSALGS